MTGVADRSAFALGLTEEELWSRSVSTALAERCHARMLTSDPASQLWRPQCEQHGTSAPVRRERFCRLERSRGALAPALQAEPTRPARDVRRARHRVQL